MLIKCDSSTALKLEVIHHIYSAIRLVKTELIKKKLYDDYMNKSKCAKQKEFCHDFAKCTCSCSG